MTGRADLLFFFSRNLSRAACLSAGEYLVTLLLRMLHNAATTARSAADVILIVTGASVVLEGCTLNMLDLEVRLGN